MRIAIIGYGSLIWDLENLAPHVTGSWQLGTGPALPVEFSRISPKREKALVLVVDRELDHTCDSCIITSRRTQLEDAVGDLAARERCPQDMIGIARREGGPACGPVTGTVRRWLATSSYDAAIWTALPGNFHAITGKRFTHRSALGYLQSLNGKALAEAWRYITLSPVQTDTPFRRYLASCDFWQALNYSRPA